MTTRILDVVDMQFDFMKSNGGLYVPNAEPLIDRTNDFFRSIPRGIYDLALIKYDTHFPCEYQNSPEKADFPDIHCPYGTQGWELVVNDAELAKRMPVYYMAKNTFDMWQQNPISDRSQMFFDTDAEEQAYDNLYHVTRDRQVIQTGELRDEFMRRVVKLGTAENVEVTMIGVASDFCVHDAMMGYLQRGANVRVVADLVAGIGTPVPGRAPKGTIGDVISLPVFQPYVQNKQLKIISLQDALKP